MNKKVMAAVLATTMVMGSSMTAFAAEGTATGTGKLEGTVNTEVFSVVLPTVAEDGSTLAFTLDPEGLIKKTNAAAYAGKVFGDGTLFFANVGDSDTTYSNTSDTLTVTNKSSVAADVTVKAMVKKNTGIALSDDKAFTDDTTASMYLAIVDANNTDGVAIGDDGATVTAEVDAAPDGAYKYSWTEDDGYTYVLDSAFAGDFETYEFKLNGAANAAGDWSGLGDAAPEVELVWEVVAHGEAPSAYVSSLQVSAASPSVTLSLPEGVTVSSVSISRASGSPLNCISGTHYTISGSTLTFAAGPMTNNVGQTVTISYSDSHTDTLTIE